MLLVVLGHSIGSTDDPVNCVILSFHMPAFFILSGMCFHPKSSDYSTSMLLMKKAKGLLWPYITFSVIGVALYWLLLAGTTKDKGVTVVQTLMGILWNDGQYGTIVTNGFWFVYDLVWITLIHILTRKISRGLRLAFATFSFAFLYLMRVDFYFSVEIIKILAGYMFFLIGDAFVANEYEKKLVKYIGGGEMHLLLSAIFASATVVISWNNTPILMYCNQYGNIILFL